MRRRDVLRSAAAAAALPLASTTVSASSQSSFEPLGVLELSGTKEVVTDDAGETAFVATTDGVATVDIADPANPELLARVAPLLDDREGGPMQQVFDVKLDGDTLIAVGPANPTRTEAVQGVVVFDVSDPANPEQTRFYETAYPIHNAYLEDGVAYLTANDGARNPVVLVDVSGGSAEELSRWSNVDHDDRWRDVYPYVRTAHDVYVHEDVLYVAYWDAGTWLADVSDPQNPEYVNHFGHYSVEDLLELDSGEAGAEGLAVPGNSHYVAVNEDASVLASGAEAWDVDTSNADPEQGGIDLWDVSDPQNPEKLSFIAPPPTPDGTRDGTWTTSHNFEFRNGRLYTSWYQGGVKVHDVSDPANPEELAWWRQPEEARFWTARYATEDAFVAGNMGGQTYDAGVYTFPNAAGEQPDPPNLETTTVATTTAPDATETAQTTAATTATSAPTTTESGESGSGVPGFGALAALAGVSAAALAAWRRNDA
ncbi:PGF-CTERM sorting domain-containing protein [Halobacterium sp. R2-5]|uniref:LVIVD repeat-containing protein n=1 Tax=Halobacterium sp. R2-5 TaxID=2715751 RepID=UPI00141EF5BF|nr:PGF-CTERM sorting domain-containing protein [Halobacterium sp. R2-5]NIB98434.1 PGF-CTERM sorting domain-containing protein [Halobacterium sp. R2-5]